jgi:hypothetical protein
MIGNNPSILTLQQPCDLAVDWIVEQIRQAGLSVIRTFDLKVARNAQDACPCPHHGTQLCDCQMVVLLVYAGEAEPVTLIAHGYDRQTVFSVVDTPQQHADPRVETAIRHCFP